MDEAGRHRDARLFQERMASLGTLVAGMAHEINNPITYLLANLAELERIGAATRDALCACQDALEHAQTPDLETVRAAESKLEGIGGLDLAEELLDECGQAAARIRDLVRDLLSLARPEAELPRHGLDVHALLEFVVRMLRVETCELASIVRDYEATLLVRAAKGSLGLVLLNLIRNAAQSCVDGDPEQSRVTLRTRDLEREVEIAVQDNGCGVPPDARARLFLEPFSTKPEGVGMGLCVSRRLIEEQGGTLDFSPASGGGSVFTVRLPRANRAVSE